MVSQRQTGVSNPSLSHRRVTNVSVKHLALVDAPQQLAHQRSELTPEDRQFIVDRLAELLIAAYDSDQVYYCK